MEKITVLFPVYNEPINYVERALESIIEQTYDKFIIFIVLDNPNNIEMINYINKQIETEPRIKFRVNRKNLGLATTLNTMIEDTNTKYIARMDADDISACERFRLQIEFMEQNPSIDLCGSNNDYIDQNGKTVSKANKIPLHHKDIKYCLKFQNCISHPTYFAKTSVMKKIMYRNELKYAQDYDFICRCVENGFQIENMAECLLHYRVGNISDSKLIRQSMTAYFVKLFYRKGELSQINNIGKCIDNEIESFGEKRLEENAVTKKLINEIVLNIKEKKIRTAIKQICILMRPHKYKIDILLSRKKYMKYISKI